MILQSVHGKSDRFLGQTKNFGIKDHTQKKARCSGGKDNAPKDGGFRPDSYTRYDQILFLSILFPYRMNRHVPFRNILQLKPLLKTVHSHNLVSCHACCVRPSLVLVTLLCFKKIPIKLWLVKNFSSLIKKKITATYQTPHT